MLRLNRSGFGVISLEQGLRHCSWGGFQWMYCEPFQVKSCLNYKSSKDPLQSKDFNMPINKESKFVASTFDPNELLFRKEKESQILIKQSQEWVDSLLSVDRVFSVFQDSFSGDVHYKKYCSEKYKLIETEISVFECAQKNENIDLFLRVSRIQKSNERLVEIKNELLEKCIKCFKEDK